MHPHTVLETRREPHGHVAEVFPPTGQRSVITMTSVIGPIFQLEFDGQLSNDFWLHSGYEWNLSESCAVLVCVAITAPIPLHMYIHMVRVLVLAPPEARISRYQVLLRRWLTKYIDIQ